MGKQELINFIATLDNSQVTGKLAQIEKGVKRTASKTDDSFKKMAASVLKFNAGMNQSIELAKKIGSAFKTVGEMAVKSFHYDKFIENTAYNIDRLSNSLGGMIDKFTLGKTASLSMAMGLNFTEKQFGNISKAAVIASQKIGITATHALESLTLGIARSSPKILDNLGLIVKAGEANSRWAAMLGKSTRELTDSEKAAGYKSLALEKLNDLTASSTLETEGAGNAYTQLGNKIDNATLAIGKLLNESDALENFFGSLGKQVKTAVDFFKGWAEIIKDVTRGIDEISEKESGLPAKEFGLSGNETEWSKMKRQEAKRLKEVKNKAKLLVIEKKMLAEALEKQPMGRSIELGEVPMPLSQDQKDVIHRAAVKKFKEIAKIKRHAKKMTDAQKTMFPGEYSSDSLELIELRGRFHYNAEQEKMYMDKKKKYLTDADRRAAKKREREAKRAAKQLAARRLREFQEYNEYVKKMEDADAKAAQKKIDNKIKLEKYLISLDSKHAKLKIQVDKAEKAREKATREMRVGAAEGTIGDPTSQAVDSLGKRFGVAKDQVDNLKISMAEMGAVGKGSMMALMQSSEMAMAGISQSIGSAIGAIINGEESASVIMKKVLKEFLTGMSQKMAAQAFYHTGMAIGSIWTNPPAVATHLAAAAAFTAGAAATGIGASAISTPSTSTAGSSGKQSTSTGTGAQSSTSSGNQGTSQVVFNINTLLAPEEEDRYAQLIGSGFNMAKQRGLVSL